MEDHHATSRDLGLGMAPSDHDVLDVLARPGQRKGRMTAIPSPAPTRSRAVFERVGCDLVGKLEARALALFDEALGARAERMVMTYLRSATELFEGDVISFRQRIVRGNHRNKRIKQNLLRGKSGAKVF